MRERTLFAAALVIGIWAAACSKPSSGNSRQSDPAVSGTPANLVSNPEAGLPVVSGLEAGHDPRLALPRAVNRKPADSRVARGMGEKPTVDPGSEAEHQHAVLAAASLLPEMRMTATAVAALTPLLAPAALPLAPTPGPERVLGNHDSDPGLSGGSR